MVGGDWAVLNVESPPYHQGLKSPPEECIVMH
jgi:hypothetical protein